MCTHNHESMFSTGTEDGSGYVIRILKSPAFLIVVLGLAIRFLLAPFLTYDFDVYHWGVIIENIQSGNGLYEVAGYYYTPVWGYFLGTLSILQDALMNLDLFGIKFTDMLPLEDLICRFHTSIITSPAFNVAMKVPLIICDVAVAILLHWLVKERTHDERKATAAVALWMLCPTVIYMSGVQTMFDSFSALMMLLTVILVYRDRTFIAGAMFSVATLLKFFPAFCIIVLVAYIYVKHRDDGKAIVRIAEAAVGAGLMTVVLIIPQILDGTVIDALSFVIGRVDGSTDAVMSAVSYVSMALMLVSMFLFGYKMLRTEGNEDDMLFKYVLLAFALAMVTSVTPQYMIVFLPFLILQLVSSEGRYRACWLLISIGSFIAALSINNLSLLVATSEYMGMLSSGWIIDCMQALESIKVLGMDIVSLTNGIGGVIEAVGILLIPIIYYREWISRKVPAIGGFVSGLREWKFE